MEMQRRYQNLNNYVMNSKKIEKQIKKKNVKINNENEVKQDIANKKFEALQTRKQEVHHKAA
jgi:hypothetical protein